jgi:hypothetical protein
MTNEDKLFWEKFGITRRDRDTLSGLFGGWEYVDSKGNILSGDNPPEPTLDNLFRYCVPHYIDLKCRTLHIDDIEAYTYLFAGWQKQIQASAEHIGKYAYKTFPVLALKKAIEEIVK